MHLEWSSTTSAHQNQQIHHANCNSTDNEQKQKAINESLDKAIALFPNNIQDDSLYFLTEWDETTSTLNLLITDDTKKIESKEVVRCQFLKTNNDQDESTSDDIKYWIRDYLTTSSGFIRFSLVAAFGTGNRERMELL